MNTSGGITANTASYNAIQTVKAKLDKSDNNSFFFQRVEDTTYGSFINITDDYHNPKPHFCTCGGLANQTTTA